MRVSAPACSLWTANVWRSLWGVGADIEPAGLDYFLLDPGGEVPICTDNLAAPSPQDVERTACYASRSTWTCSPRPCTGT